MSTYNGHKNWNHWNVSLWINNDEGLYRLALGALYNNPRDRAQAVRDLMKFLPEKTPDGAPYTQTSARAALVGII